MTDAIHHLGLLEVSGRIRRRELTSEAVTRALLDRIARLDGGLHSFLQVLTDSALDQARQADREIAAGFWRGPLHGVPLGIKDLVWMKGLPATAGMALLRDFRPDEDATAIKRLVAAGAVLIGRLNMTEGALLEHHPEFPRPVNPWSAPHWTGVSSSGSGVAPAAGFCFGALGTDTGGSIRMPSAANNLTGIKPTWGRVSRHGVMPLSESLDHLGPMARSAADAAAILQVIAGADRDDPTALSEPVPDYLATLNGGISGLTIGIDWQFVAEDTPDEVVNTLHETLAVLESLGARIRDVAFPSTQPVNTEISPLLVAEFAAAHAGWFPAQADRYGPRVRNLLEAAPHFPTAAVVRAYQARDRFTGQVRGVFHDCDLMLTPGLGIVTPTWDEIETMQDDMALMNATVLRFTTPFNVAGVPTISLPAGFSSEGLPLGVQLIGWKLEEEKLIRAGHAFQKATDFHTRHPALD